MVAARANHVIFFYNHRVNFIFKMLFKHYPFNYSVITYKERSNRFQITSELLGGQEYATNVYCARYKNARAIKTNVLL